MKEAITFIKDNGHWFLVAALHLGIFGLFCLVYFQEEIRIFLNIH